MANHMSKLHGKLPVMCVLAVTGASRVASLGLQQVSWLQLNAVTESARD